MATVKIVLRQKKNKDGAFPLAIRITKDRRTSFIHLGKYVKDTEWDAVTQTVKKTHPNSKRLNNFLIKKLSEATDSALELETQKTEFSSNAVKQKIKPSQGETFLAQAQVYLDTLKKAGKFNRYSADKPRISRFKEFLNGSDIAFSDITISMLERFKAHLKSTRKISTRTIVNHLVLIRSVFSQAINENIVDRKYYPFGKGKIKIKFPDSNKIGLESKEVEGLENLELKNPTENHARNVWLFSFYFAGMRVSDALLLKWSDIQNDRLHYSMGKNEKWGSLKLPVKALKILTQYKRESPANDLVFPDLESVLNMKDKFAVQTRIKTRVRFLNDNLKEVAKLAKINKKLTMHISRHTFGNISGDKIPLQMLQKLYRHSSITTTIGYQSNFIHRDADDALDSVVNF